MTERLRVIVDGSVDEDARGVGHRVDDPVSIEHADHRIDAGGPFQKFRAMSLDEASGHHHPADHGGVHLHPGRGVHRQRPPRGRRQLGPEIGGQIGQDRPQITGSPVKHLAFADSQEFSCDSPGPSDRVEDLYEVRGNRIVRTELSLREFCVILHDKDLVVEPMGGRSCHASERARHLGVSLPFLPIVRLRHIDRDEARSPHRSSRIANRRDTRSGCRCRAAASKESHRQAPH